MNFLQKCNQRLVNGECGDNVLKDMRERYTTIRCLRVKTGLLRKMYNGPENPEFIHKLNAIKEEYPDALLVVYNPYRTIQFGSTCKHILLSHGTFSAMIGYLAFYSKNIYYPNIKPKWGHLEIFKNKSDKFIGCI